MFGEGGSCTQKMRRDSSENEVPQSKTLKARGQWPVWGKGGAAAGWVCPLEVSPGPWGPEW